MADRDNARVTTEAVELGIKSLAAYASQLEEFRKRGIAKVNGVGETHRDQNYKKFKDYFTPRWKKMEDFKREVEDFQDYLVKQKDIIIRYILEGNRDKQS